MTGASAVSTAARLCLLGTAGGALTYPRAGVAPRFGPCFALEVGGETYLVDAGQGAARQLTLARSTAVHGSAAFNSLRAIFLTHLHSDHVMDLNNLLLCGPNQGWPQQPVKIWGPGPGDTRGTANFLERLVDAFDVDRLSRRTEGVRPASIEAHDILVPSDASIFTVYEDDRLAVRAAVVDHGASSPCLAYRFDMDAGSVVFSGDTAPTTRLTELARGADVLVHEVMDAEIEAWLTPQRNALSRERLDVVLAKHSRPEDVVNLASDAGVGLLVVAPVAPGDLPAEHWAQAMRAYSGRLVVGEDLMVIGPDPNSPRNWKVHE